ncbi:hypothetical protein B0H14DRAFT_2594583 [Mycena olivaceomarginata]|nr:hypothetical protein B0H14DRAFT_2594583 [Mycena olivaceomarginata]
MAVQEAPILQVWRIFSRSHRGSGSNLGRNPVLRGSFEREKIFVRRGGVMGADAPRVCRARTPGTLRCGLDREGIVLTMAESDPPSGGTWVKKHPYVRSKTAQKNDQVALGTQCNRSTLPYGIYVFTSGHWANARLKHTGISTPEIRVGVADAYLSGHRANSRLTGTAISAAEMRIVLRQFGSMAVIPKYCIRDLSGNEKTATKYMA